MILPDRYAPELNPVYAAMLSHCAAVADPCRVGDWATLPGDVVVVAPLLDRLMYHGHLLKFEGKNWRPKEAAARIAKRASTE